MDEEIYNLKPARNAFSRIGLMLCAFFTATTVLQLLWFRVPALIWGPDNWLSSSSWGYWLGTFIPMYVIALPLAMLILLGIPARKPEENKLGAKGFLRFLPIVFFVIYSGNILGTVLSLLLSGGTAENQIAELAMDNNPLKIVVMVILAPVMEEFVFRKLIIDRTARYGEKVAVFLSALTFGLFHMNLFQFFYAFGIGLVLGYLYVRTGRLRYTVLIHGIVNFMGAVVAPLVLSLSESVTATTTQETLQALPALLVILLYGQLLLGMSVAGLVLLIVTCRRLVWKTAESPLPKGTCVKTVYLNVGMILFVVLCLVFMVLSLI